MVNINRQPGLKELVNKPNECETCDHMNSFHIILQHNWYEYKYSKDTEQVGVLKI